MPVRIPLPNRDNLIAMGLMALALGLITGVAIVPGLGAAGNAVAGVVVPPAASVPEGPATDEGSSENTTVELGTPAGSETLASVTPDDDSTASVTDEPADLTPAPPAPEPEPVEKLPVNDLESDPDEPVKEEPEVDQGTALKGTVAGVDTNGRRFSLTDSSGNVLVIFGLAVPNAGKTVSTRILSLANGTFGETGERTLTGTRSRSKLRGTVSWFDPVSRMAVVSNRGSSLPVDLSSIPEDPASVIGLGSPVEGTVLIAEPVEAAGTEPARPGLRAEKMTATGEPLDRIEMSGILRSVDETGRQLVIAADSSGLFPAEITVKVPKAFPFETVTAGKTYDLSVTIAPGEKLTLTGLSAGYSKKSADDAEVAFGDHG